MPKVTIVGAGAVGSQLAYNLAAKNLADIVLVDIVEGLPQGRALDILESMPLLDSDSKILGTNGFADLKDSDVVVVTAGLPRKPGMARDDLVQTNAKILNSVIPEVIKHSPDCILIIVTNPLSAMAQLAFRLSSFPKERVIGMAGVLDSSRLRCFIAEKLDVSVSDVDAFVIGDHGDLMVPVLSKCSVNGVPVVDILSKDDLGVVAERVRNAGGEIVSLLKNESTCFAPAAALSEMVDCIINDKKRVLPCTVLLEGEYGVNGLFVGVPIKLGKSGVEEIIEFDLSGEEKDQFRKFVEHIRGLSRAI
ncbi:malate dehydrogenase [Candidatus Woesearchaeota archaeon]|nr:MAG: malate dehydrogenase [Candidatus Woesearchaeota archaeon]